jgi:hypothetical protein
MRPRGWVSSPARPFVTMPTTYARTLDDTVQAALSWVTRNLRFYDLTGGPSRSELRFKAFVELVFLALPLLRGANPPRAAHTIAEFAHGVISRCDWDGALATDPATALFGCAIALDLTRVMGLRFPVAIEKLRVLAADGVGEDLERVPYRRMDRAYSFARAGLVDEPDLRALFHATGLGTSASAPVFSRHDLYGITHTLFYVTDMGFRPAELFLAPDELNRARRAVRLGTAVARADRDPDLLGEMLLCWAALDIPPDELTTAGWRFIFDWQRDDGSVPPPSSFVPPVTDDADERARITWEYRYHTTMVTALAGAIWGRRYEAA